MRKINVLMNTYRYGFYLTFLSWVLGAASCQAQQENDYYEVRNASPGGTGKWYMSSEIAHVMGFQGANWWRDKTGKRRNVPTC